MAKRMTKKGKALQKKRDHQKLLKDLTLTGKIHFLDDTHIETRGRRFGYLCSTQIIGKIRYTKQPELITCVPCQTAREELIEFPKFWVRSAEEDVLMAWEDVGSGGGGKDFLKLETGQKVRLHVLSEEPHSFYQYFNEKAKRSVIVPADWEGGEKRAQHAMVVLTMIETVVKGKKTATAGEGKLWIMSNTVAAELKNIYDNYSGLSTVDIILSRNGTGKNTKYGVVPVPTQFTDDMVEGLALPDPTDHPGLKEGTDESIEAVLNGEAPEGAGPEAAAEPEPGAEAEATSEPEPAGDVALEEGMRVMHEEHGGGEIKSLDNDDMTAFVKFDSGHKESVAQGNLTPEGAAPEPEPAPAKPKPTAAKPAPKPANGAKPAPAKAPAAGVDPRTALIRVVMHGFATKPKFKDPKVRAALLKKISKKTIVSQFSLDELKKLAPLVK